MAARLRSPAPKVSRQQAIVDLSLHLSLQQGSHSEASPLPRGSQPAPIQSQIEATFHGFVTHSAAVGAHTHTVSRLAGSGVTLRGLILVLFSFALVGLAVELTFLEHYEDRSMMIPLAAIAAALLAVVVLVVRPTPRTVWLFRAVTVVFALVGVVGVVLHYQGSLAFQVDMDPTASASTLFWKVMHMKAPPTLAPGAMVQLGLLGLLSTYRHPVLVSHRSPFSKGESS